MRDSPSLFFTDQTERQPMCSYPLLIQHFKYAADRPSGLFTHFMDMILPHIMIHITCIPDIHRVIFLNYQFNE